MRVISMVLLCERHCVPSCPCWPPVPPTSRALPPLCVLPVCPPVLLLFFFVPSSRSPLLPRTLRLPPALPRAIPVPLPCARSLACLPSHSPPRCRPCLYVCPPCLSRAVTRLCHPRALPLLLPLAPTLSPGVSPTLVLPRSPSLTPSWLPCALCGRGGGVSADLTVALPEDWHGCWFPTHHELPHVPKEHRENVRETLVKFPSLHLHCGAQPYRPAADQSPHLDPARSPRVHTSLHLAGVPWRRQPPKPGVVNPSEQGARKSNGFNAAPSCHAESFAAM